MFLNQCSQSLGEYTLISNAKLFAQSPSTENRKKFPYPITDDRADLY